MENFNYFQENNDLKYYQLENFPLFNKKFSGLDLFQQQNKSNSNMNEWLIKDLQQINQPNQQTNLYDILGQIKNEKQKTMNVITESSIWLKNLNNEQNDLENRQQQSQDKKQQKLKRNRQTAKMCRQRKKQYVSILENKNKKYQKRIQQLETELKQVSLQRDRLKNTTSTYIKSFQQLQKQLYLEIEDCLKNNDKAPQTLNNALNQLENRFGSNGRDRVNLIDYYMSEIIQNLLCDIHKYMINSFINNRGLFGQNNRNIQFQLMQVCQKDKDNDQCDNQMKKIFKPKIEKELSEFNEALQTFYNSHVKLRMKCVDIQELFVSMKAFHSQVERANIVLWFYKNKNRKDLNLRAQWYEVCKGSQNQLVDSIRKIRKFT